ncbi:MAG TPA: DUF192 domain-containing protein [Dehalococcoidia bacterium]|nr:DUF192 domain-containing protein [Dehalococcoidia bacterium]
MARIAVHNRTRGTELGQRVRVADNPWTRFIGLLGRGTLQQGDGLHITPCSSVHMFFMRIPLDIVYLDKENRVVKTVRDLRPWRISAGRGAKSVLELPVGTIDASGTRVGDELALEPAG